MLPPILIVFFIAISVIAILRVLAWQKYLRIMHRKGLNHERIEKQIKNPVGACQFLVTDYSNYPD